MLKLIGSMKNGFGGIKSFLKAQFVSTIHKGTSQDKCDVAGDTTKNYQFKSFVMGYFAILSRNFAILCALCKIKRLFFWFSHQSSAYPRMFELFLLIFRQFQLSRIFVFSRFKLYRITNPSQFISSASFFASNLEGFFRYMIVSFFCYIIFFSSNFLFYWRYTMINYKTF